MSYNNIKAYKSAFVTMEKIDQVIALYDTAVASLAQAKQAITDKNIEERFNKVKKSYDIVSGLRDCIDYENGGEVAQVLKQWYTDIALSIISINRTDSLEMCDICVENLRTMRTAWAEAKEISQGEELESKAETQGEKIAPIANVESFGDNLAAFNLQGLSVSV